MWVYHDLSSSKQGLEDEFPLNMGKYHGLCELGDVFVGFYANLRSKDPI